MQTQIHPPRIHTLTDTRTLILVFAAIMLVLALAAYVLVHHRFVDPQQHTTVVLVKPK